MTQSPLTADGKFVALVNEASAAPSGPEIVHAVLDLGALLVAKNKSYGDSALNPIRVFSDASTEEQILVRIDDKLSRLQRGNDYLGEDTLDDMMGYLVLLKIVRARVAAAENPEAAEMPFHIGGVLSEEIDDSADAGD